MPLAKSRRWPEQEEFCRWNRFPRIDITVASPASLSLSLSSSWRYPWPSRLFIIYVALSLSVSLSLVLTEVPVESLKASNSTNSQTSSWKFSAFSREFQKNFHPCGEMLKLTRMNSSKYKFWFLRFSYSASLLYLIVSTANTDLHVRKSTLIVVFKACSEQSRQSLANEREYARTYFRLCNCRCRVTLTPRWQ